jgi:hypothetical protein
MTDSPEYREANDDDAVGIRGCTRNTSIARNTEAPRSYAGYSRRMLRQRRIISCG